MTLLLRAFRSNPGKELTLLGALQREASVIIQRRDAEAVLIYQRADDTEYIFWIESCRCDLRPVPTFVILHELGSVEDALRDVSPPTRLEFMDAFYRFPIPSCQLWSVKVRVSVHQVQQTLEHLLHALHGARADGQIIGASLYRVAGESGTIIGFLALSPGGTPAALLASDGGRIPATGAEFSSYPISVAWTLGRLSPGVVSPDRYPRTAFWSRASTAV
jgi:hypothetical protein